MILRWLFKLHDWLYKGDGTRTCMACGRVEKSEIRHRRREANKTIWKCIKRGDETKQPCGESYYDDYGLKDRGPAPQEDES